jgi:UDP-GlcNAc:undecaprenyl-phosphate GlcNAc-1-phosphate transferase
LIMNHYSPLISALVTLFLTLILTLNKEGLLQDIPNDRSLHTEPIPRTGGIALMAGILSGWMLMLRSWDWWIVLPALGLFVLSLVDDMRNLSPRTRLVGHSIAAVIVLSGSGVDLPWTLPILLYIVWMTNLYNFMNFSIGAAALGFLYYNFNPARVFMGDAGSIPLGFLAAAFGLLGWQREYWPFWFPVLVFSPFVADATFTLLRRLLRKERLSQAHRSHYYQRLVQMGWGHRKTALAEYALMLAAGATALWGISLDFQGQANLLAWWASIYIGLTMVVDRRWNKYKVDKNNEP